jgi:hypothetical protein
MKSIIKLLSMSDLHLGHPVNKTNLIIANLDKFFIKHIDILRELDIICLVGDVFDRLHISSSDDYILSINWLIKLVNFCKENKIKLRILEGTPSHDWKQARVLTTFIEKLNIDVDYKYIESLYIEEIQDLNLTILYIPDEYKHDATDTYNDVKKLLLDKKISQVDIAYIHGQFDYQAVNNHKSITQHNSNNYLSIVKHWISVGHIHTSSINSRIIAQGSFDRLRHNEEEDKGCYYLTISDTGNTFQFLKNDNAMIFKTINLEGKSLEDVLLELDNVVPKLPINSNVRVIVSNIDFVTSNINLSTRYPNVNIKIERKVVKEEIVEEEILYETFNITKDNIVELVMDELNSKSYTADEISNVIKELKEIK